MFAQSWVKQTDFFFLHKTTKLKENRLYINY